jgi:hypothetical protein
MHRDPFVHDLSRDHLSDGITNIQHDIGSLGLRYYIEAKSPKRRSHTEKLPGPKNKSFHVAMEKVTK